MCLSVVSTDCTLTDRFTEQSQRPLEALRGKLSNGVQIEEINETEGNK